MESKEPIMSEKETMNMNGNASAKPEILSPAGNEASFLAALAAGADAVYCGLKAFSARMEAENFAMDDLAKLTCLAHEKGAKVYVALNSLVKPGELSTIAEIVHNLRTRVNPDGLIVQDLAVSHIARTMNFPGEIHLSTLANVSSAGAAETARKFLKADRVVLPRELDIDEIKSVAEACPDGPGLEVFVHGALCYAVSGRCYWSSYLGGKSGLRGRCVQPCRRRYRQGDLDERLFSCLDLSLDVLAKVLSDIPQIKAWKIEGRKKGPHYVYYTTRAYRIMRDEGSDPQKKKEALELLAYSLGRPGTHFNFLPQRPQNPIKKEGQTGSGLLVGILKGTGGQQILVPREQLFAGDLLRVGYEDDPGHALHKVTKWIPKKGRLVLKTNPGDVRKRVGGAPVFLIDRRAPELNEQLETVRKELSRVETSQEKPIPFRFKEPRQIKAKGFDKELRVFRKIPKAPPSGRVGVWLDSGLPEKISKKSLSTYWWWLPPLVWPNEEQNFKALLDSVVKGGGKNFVLNAPWQISYFSKPLALNLWAGPFCNLANSYALKTAKKMGFKGAVASPELGEEDLLQLPSKSPLQMGIVLRGNWPLCISRNLADELEPGKAFSSPKGEIAWAQKHGSTFWLYPNWRLDLGIKKRELLQAGYCLFIYLKEPVPRDVPMKKRSGLWNWEIGLR